MGTYVDIDDIQNQFRSVDFGASNANVTDAKVTEFISQAEAYIESKISCKYAVPITASAATPIVKTIATYIVADRVAKIMKIKTNNQSSQDETKSLNEIAEEMLQAICEGDLKLIGATLQESGNGLNSWTNQNTSTFSRTFKRGSDQW